MSRSYKGRLKELPHRKKAVYAEAKDGRTGLRTLKIREKAIGQGQACHAMTFEFCPVQCENE